MKPIFKIFPLISLIFLFSCNERITTGDDGGFTPVITPVGDSTSFEMATWNLAFFPQQGMATINATKDIIRGLGVDMYGVEEIADIDAFNQLVDSLDGWKGILSDDTYSDGSYQKTGLLYNARFITVSGAHSIFTNDSYAFPRPPLQAYVEVKDAEGLKYNFNAIVLHLKARGGADNEARRKAACDKLEAYIREQIANGADADFVVLGDWNDQVSDPQDTNVFNAFLSKTDQYRFLTQGLTESSYISTTYASLIDHIMITSDSEGEYDGGVTEVRYLDNDIPNFRSVVSDHRPVISYFRGFKIILN